MKSVSFYFIPVRHGMRLKQESDKIMTVCAKKGMRENDVVVFLLHVFIVLMYAG